MDGDYLIKYPVFDSYIIDTFSLLQVLQPSGWETGLDSSGVRTTAPLGLV